MARIHKAGTQSDADPFEYVMSDETVDRVGDVIEAAGWNLREFKKNPIALFAHSSRDIVGQWEHVRIEGKRLIGRLKMAAAGTSPLVDTLRSLIEQRILKAVSVGFEPQEAVPIHADRPYGPQRFKKQTLFECSLVAIPANPNALSLAKSLSDSDRALLFAEPGNQPQRDRTPRAEPGKTSPLRKGHAMSGLANRIQESQAIIIGLRDLHTPLAKRIAGDGEELTDDEAGEFDRLSAELEAEEKNLGRLRQAERSIAGKSIIVPDGGRQAAPAISTSGVLTARKGRPMDLLVRMGVASLLAHANRQPMSAVLEKHYKEADDLAAVVKAVTNPAMTDVAGWAAELVDTAIADFLEELRPRSVYAQLAPKGLKFSFDRNGVIKIPRRNYTPNAPGDLRGAFVGEGQPIPVRRGSFGSLSLYPYKMAVISTFSKEIAARSTPAIEGLIRTFIIEDTAVAIDTALLDNVALVAGVRPAGLLNGVTPTAGAAGANMDAVIKDITALTAPFVAANAADNIVLIMNPSDAMRLGLITNAVGDFAFRDEIARGTLLGFSLIQSTTVPAKTVIAVRASDFASATGDTPEFDVSDQATIHEEDGGYPANQAMPDPAVAPGPLPIVSGPTGTPVAATPVRSLWQTASLGVRMLLDMSWGMRRAGMVTAVNAITW